ncbi:MAG: hypothetical protein PHO76_01960 [Methylotenera sp.]|nr:hypothetical protein [Methylotenera sp.]MDD4925537.1 hypothetical protein [Methylotenera sp.]
MQQLNTEQQISPFPPMSLKELAEFLIKQKKIHEGKFDLSIEFQIGVGGVGPTPETVVPGAMIGVSKIGLIYTSQDGPHTVDASVVNPRKSVAKRK